MVNSTSLVNSTDSTQAYIDALPDELLSNIFHLAGNNHSSAITLTSSRWRGILNDNYSGLVRRYQKNPVLARVIRTDEHTLPEVNFRKQALAVYKAVKKNADKLHVPFQEGNLDPVYINAILEDVRTRLMVEDENLVGFCQALSQAMPRNILGNALKRVANSSKSDTEKAKLLRNLLNINRDRLQSITELDLSNANLRGLPAEIGLFDQLQVLNLSQNKIASLPPEIGTLINLEELNLDDNYLDQLPPEIGKLQNLHYLYLNLNCLTELPPEIGDLTELSLLMLQGNSDLSQLPKEMIKIKELCHLMMPDGQSYQGEAIHDLVAQDKNQEPECPQAGNSQGWFQFLYSMFA